MRSLGLSIKDIRKLKKTSIVNIEKVFSKITAGGIFSTSRTYGAARQRTHEFPPAVNTVDSQMEKFIRDESIPILNAVIRGTVNVTKAFSKIRYLIASHFRKACEHLDAVISGIKEYQLLSHEIRQLEEGHMLPSIDKKDSLNRACRMNFLKKFFKLKNQRGCGRMKISFACDRIESLKMWRTICATQEEGSRRFMLQQKPLTQAEKNKLLCPLEMVI